MRALRINQVWRRVGGALRRRWRVPFAIVAAHAVAAGTIAGVHHQPGGGWGPAPASFAGKPVPVHVVKGRQVKLTPMRPYRRPRTSWPAAGSGTVAITAAAPAVRGRPALAAGPPAGSSRAGALPVWIGPPDTTSLVRSAVVSRARVIVATRATVSALGVHGTVIGITRADGRAGPGRVHVSVDYSAFAHAYGGDYAARLRFVELPGCALTTPRRPACHVQTQVRGGTADSVAAGRAGVDVTLSGQTSAAVVLALTAAPSGSSGSYAAEPMSETQEWVNGDSSGAYKYSYPITVPQVPGGFEPTVSLDYNSQSVDGVTSATNPQATWIGDGWDYSPGFIEADYQTCSSLGFGFPNTGDLCLPSAGPSYTVSLNGVASTLVYSKGTYRAEADGGDSFTGTQDSSGRTYTTWTMTDQQGDTYHFGLNQLPGYASGDPVTNSAWTVPVMDGGQPYNWVWRWNLDYVTDAHGDAIAYFYNPQTNYYAESAPIGIGGNGQYVQGGTLARIEYGLRAGSVYGVNPAAQVNFTTSAGRQDAPTDLSCASASGCTVPSPTFWNDYSLTGISTQALAGGSLENVDSWALTDSYPATGDSTSPPQLWLASIARTGQDGATSIPLPPTQFTSTSALPNRVQTAGDTNAGYSPMTRFRLTSITSQAGAVTTIAYTPEDTACAAGHFPAPDANATACYPGYWSASGSTVQDWFNVYAAAKVTVKDTTGGNPPVVTSYAYSGPAWHFDHDTLSRSVTTTWDLWRGFGKVTTETGTPPDPVSEKVDTYYQGMSADPNPDGSAGPAVTLTSTRGDQDTDSDQFAGMLFESIVYNGAGGSEVSDVIHNADTISTFTGTPVYAEMTGDASTKTYTTLAGGGTRESTVSYTYDTTGRIATETDVPDTASPSETTCTATTYTGSTTIPDQVQESQTDSQTCTFGTVISDTRYSYDSAGDITETDKAISAGSFVKQTDTYDEYGRILTSTDADQRTTTTAYTPATGAEPTSVQVTDPAGLITTTTYDPARELPLTVTDPAADVTATSYDALGRTVSVWTPGNPSSGPAVDKYAYTVSDTAPLVTTEQVEEPGGGYRTTQTLSDSLGQVCETQTETVGGGTDVSDVSYNSDGQKALVSDPYYISGAPSGTLVAAASSSVPSQTGYVYDGAGRVIKQIAYKLGSETWETDTTYGGNYTTVVPPAGGTSQTTFTDGRGLTTSIRQYHQGVPASTSDPASDYDQTTYTYTPGSKLAGITDAAGNTWSYTYDLLGDQLTQTDPDAGTTTSTYDNAGQLISVTDARADTTSFTYDKDGRKTAEYDTTGGVAESAANQLASWTFDTIAKGKLTSSTAFENGASYIEQVTGYNSQGLPSGTSTTIPSSQGALVGTYTQSMAYAPDGAVTSYTDSPAGGLPSETVNTGYDTAGNPDSLTGASPYVASLTYTNLGQPMQYTLGTPAEPAYVTDSYDPQTSRLSEQSTQTGTGSAQSTVDDLQYGYDQVGNIKSEADTPAGAPGATDAQCFQYDYLARLVQAWAQGTAICPATPSAAAEGGAAPYWNAYTYNTIGNLTGITATPASGGVTTTADTYPSAGSAHPHGVTGETVTAPSGTTTSSLAYDKAGHLTTMTGTTQSQALTWNDAGQLTQDSVTPSGGSASPTGYIYDASGNLLITADPGTKTLYLGDEELALNTSTGTVTGTRYYTLGGVTITRTGASSVAYLVGDQQGTDSLAIDAATLATTRRYYDPYGNPRGPVPSSFPAGEKGFIGGIDDTATGLTNLGAREYQPATGSFISPDLLLKPYDPQNLNAYTYAADNPTTYSDPTGATPQLHVAGCDGSTPQCEQVTKYTGAYGCTGPTQAAVNQCVLSTEQADQEDLLAPLYNHHSDPRKPKSDPIKKDPCANPATLQLCMPKSAILDDGTQPGNGNNLQWGVPAGCLAGGFVFTCNFAASGSGKAGGGGTPGLDGLMAALTGAGGDPADAADLADLATQHVTDSGDTVLGRFPGYITKAESRGASYFDIAGKWDELEKSGIDPWELNKYFLDDRIAAGDRMLLSVPKSEIPLTGYLRDEINYLTDTLTGRYRWVNQWALVSR